MTDAADVVVFLDRQWTPGLVPTNDARPLGPATTRWSDYVGTASADDAEVRIGAPSLYESAGLTGASGGSAGWTWSCSTARPAWWFMQWRQPMLHRRRVTA